MLKQVNQGKSFILAEGNEKYVQYENAAKKMRFIKDDGQPIIRRYYIFIKASNSTKHTYEFLKL